MMCDTCITNKDMCLKCIYNPMYKDLRSYFKEYEPTCPRGYDDCVHDQAYIKYNYPEWYAALYGDKTPEEVSKTSSCQKALDDPDKEHHCLHSVFEDICYDNEDK